jgi:surface antigen
MNRMLWTASSALIALTFSIPFTAMADPPWARGEEHGHGHGKHEEQTFVQGPRGACKVVYKNGRHGYEEKWTCARGSYFRPGPPPWAPAHGYRRKHGETYVFPAGLSGGRCRPDVLGGPTVGGLVGAAVGGLTGSQIGKGNGKLAATAVGTLLGFVIGQQVGSSLARVEETCFSNTFEHVPDQQTVVWNDPNQGAQYQVTPVRTAEADNGMYCREYQAKAMIGGRVQETYGTACRMPDGAWKLMN